jgi:hypothetical protein
MLKDHFDVVEKSLLATSQIAANAGHNLHKGIPREAFVRDFLALHLPETLGIGTGEIIDSNSLPNQPRNQIDIVLYKRDFPRLNFGGGVNAFMAESVVGTIEVKSLLNEAAMRQAITTARNLKTLARHLNPVMLVGYEPPSILTYVVAYAGPASMNTVYEWLPKIHQEEGIPFPAMPGTIEQRLRIPSPSIDVIILLGKGFIYFDNSPLGVLPAAERAQHPNLKWVWVNQTDGNLLFLFLHLTQAISGRSIAMMDAMPYLSNVQVMQVAWGT